MQVTKGTWGMREQCVSGSLSSSPTQEPANEAKKRVMGNGWWLACSLLQCRPLWDL